MTTTSETRGTDAAAMASARRPQPLPSRDSLPFWEGAERGELLGQRCVECKRFRHPPRPMCPACRSMESGWVRMSGRGTIYSFVVVHPPVMPAFQDQLPMPVVLVELEENPELRLVGNVRECAREQIRIGMPVEVVFEKVAEDVALPLWRPRR